MRLSVHFASAADAGALIGRSDAVVLPGVRDRQDLLATLGTILRFPDYYGANWDAFDECLRDVSGATVVVRDAAELWTKMPSEMITLVDIWCSVAEHAERPLDLVFIL